MKIKIFLLVFFSQSIVLAADFKNQVWKVFTNTSWTMSIALSADETKLWVATRGGIEQRHASNGELVRLLINLDGLPSNRVNTLLSDKNDGLWIGTDNGLVYRDVNGKFTVYNSSNSELPANEILALSKDDQGGLWIGVETYQTHGISGLVHRSANNEWSVHKINNSELPYFSVHSILNHNGLWIGTDNGLAYRNLNGEWVVYNSKNSDLPINNINKLLGDDQGIWIGTNGGGLVFRSHDSKWIVYNTQNSELSSNDINTLIKDKRGGLWIGTHWGGLVYRNSNGQWKHKYKLPDSRVIALLTDSREGLWIGTVNGIAYRNINNEITIYEVEQVGLPLNQGLALARDSRGGLWIGTPWNGLVEYTKNGEWKRHDPNKFKLPTPNGVSSLLGDQQGGLWIGTGAGLAYRNASGKWTVDNSNNITALASDNAGIWVAIKNQGLAYRDNNGKWTNYKTDEISALAGDNKGGLWVAFIKDGLAYRSASGEWRAYKQHQNIRSLLYDNNGLWIGTNGEAMVYRSNSGELTVYNPNNSGLPSHVIQAIASDGSGGIWVVGNQGGLAHLSFGQKNAICAKLNQTNCQALQTSKRAAIIIAGGGNDQTNTLWETTESISNYIYKVLNNRGFLNDEIYYLSPKSWADFNGDGRNDRIVDAPNPERPLKLEDVRNALNWAKTRGKLDQPLYLFFNDHGGSEKFQLDKFSYMLATEFKTILDDYQAETANKIVLVIDACYSGSLLKQLIAPNRAIISSTGNGLAYFDRSQKQGFSRFLANGLLKGMNFLEAFEYATRKQRKMLGNLSELLVGSTTTTTNFSQEPQLEDGEKGQWLSQLFLNGSFVTADLTLAIEGLTKSTSIKAGDSLNIKAKVGLAQGKIIKVWAVIIPPKINLVMDNNGTPILSFPRLFLSKSEENIWETNWHDAVYNGNYEIIFYAEDNQGNIVSSDNSVVIAVTGGIKPPAQANVEILLDKDRYQAGDSFKVQLIENLAWGYDLYAAVILPDGQFMALKNTNELALPNQVEKYLALRSQNNPLTLLNLNLPNNLTKGKYCLYGILSPEGGDVLKSMPFWVMQQQCFEVQ